MSAIVHAHRAVWKADAPSDPKPPRASRCPGLEGRHHEALAPSCADRHRNRVAVGGAGVAAFALAGGFQRATTRERGGGGRLGWTRRVSAAGLADGIVWHPRPC
jgi:hypothetical protein